MTGPASSPARFAGVVLCGGESRRMGADKALIEVDGQPMAVRVAEALHAAGASPVIALGGDGRALEAAGLEVHADRWPGEGPLGAIVQSLEDIGADPVVVVLACDLTDPDPVAIRRLVADLEDGDADVAVPLVDGRPQWLHAAWRRRVARVLGDVFKAGERSVFGAVRGLEIRHDDRVAPAAVADADTPDALPGAELAPPLPTIQDVDIPVIDVEALAAKLEGGAPVFDVRQPDEYEEAHVPGVTLVPLAEVPDQVEQFPTDGEVYVICRSGARSAKAVEFLRQQGVDAVNVAGGTLSWIEAGHPVETGA